MTTKQKQCLLCYLGYYSGTIDGIWGKQSAAAEAAFRKENGMDATKENLLQAITKSKDWWENIAYFIPSEFACKCGGNCSGYPAEMSRVLVETADELRRHFGAAVSVSSGLRCSAHNARVGGVANSRHLSGKAMDFCVAGKTAAQVLSYIRQLPQIRYAYAIDSRYVHMDVD